jgi:predicted enzyme related to lactoylglutathione lyase
VFGIYRSNGPSRSWNGTPVVGRFSWHELMTTDYQKAFDFYRRLFGWEKTSEMDMGGGNMYFMYGKGKPFGGIFNRPPEMAGMPPFWLCYVHVKDVQKAVDTATRSGARLQRGPMEVPGGMIAILGDPQGAGFAVHHVNAAAAAPAAAKQAAKATSLPKPKAAKKRSAAKKKTAAKKRPAAKKRSAAKKSTRKRATKSKRRGR